MQGSHFIDGAVPADAMDGQCIAWQRMAWHGVYMHVTSVKTQDSKKASVDAPTNRLKLS